MCKSWEVESPKNKADGTVKLRPILLVFETKSLNTGTMNEQLRVTVGGQNAKERSKLTIPPLLVCGLFG